MILARLIFQRILLGAALLVVAWAFLHVAVREIGGRGNHDAAITLRVMHWSGGGGQEEDAIVADAIANFERSHPGIRVQRINPGDSGQFLTKLQTMMAAGTPPDVFYMDYKRLPSFVGADQIEPLDAWLERDAASGDPDALDINDFFPPTVDAFRWDGSEFSRGDLWGLPKDFTTLGFYYNRALFQRAGLAEPASDWTWDDFAATARAIGELESCTGAVFVTWPFVLRGYLWTEGARIRGETWDDLTLDDPALLAALERLRGWRHDEENMIAKADMQGISPESRFLTGTIGMVGPLGRWVVPTFRNIKEPEEERGFDWDFAPMPRGRESANVVATVAWSMSNRSEHPEEAWTLLRYLAGAEAQARLSRLGLAIPTLRSVAESDAFIDPTQRPSRDRDFLNAAAVARVPDWPADPRFETQFGSITDDLLRKGLPADQAMVDLSDWWRGVRESPLERDDFAPVPWTPITVVVFALLAVGAIVMILRLRRSSASRAERAEERAGWLMITPWLIGFTAFMAFPIGLSLVLSLTRWNGIGPLDSARFVGLANYLHVITHDGTFHTSLRVTLTYAVIAVISGQAFALGAAILLNSRLRGIEFFRAAWYLPSVLAGVGVAVLFQWVFKSDGGLLNTALEPLLEPFGLTPPQWFNTDAGWAGPPAFAIMNLWLIGGSMMIYLAGLRNIPRELYEAAAIDRVGAIPRFFHITLPMLGPVILFNGIMAIIASFQVFTQAYVMTSGGPRDDTRFYVLYLYNLAFDFYRMGYASALAWLLLIVVLGLTLIILKVSSRFVYYEAMNS